MRSAMRNLPAALIAPALLLIAARSAAAGDAAAPAQVQIVDFMRFDPPSLSVPAGTTVTWVNHDGSNHIIQFRDAKSPRLRHDARYSRRFDTPGEYRYVCAIHGERMSGTIVVTAPP